jgi:hypothetical protein
MLLLMEGCGMGVPSRWVLFSEVHGKVLVNGEPVAGAEIIETAKISTDTAKNPTQRTTTNAQGIFHFPTLVKKLSLVWRLLPAQPVVIQTIIIRYQGIDYKAWNHGKMTFEANTELDGQPLDFVCELTDKPEYEGTHYGICRPVARLPKDSTPQSTKP